MRAQTQKRDKRTNQEMWMVSIVIISSKKCSHARNCLFKMIKCITHDLNVSQPVGKWSKQIRAILFFFFFFFFSFFFLCIISSIVVVVIVVIVVVAAVVLILILLLL